MARFKKIRFFFGNLLTPTQRRKIRKVFSPFRRIGIKKKFTLISDDCWGGIFYDKMGLQYLTPTIGLYIKPEDFIKFVSNLKYYISLTPVGLKEQPSNLPNKQDNHLFIARLGDITLNFIHYKSLEDGIAKWERRKKRICWNNIIVKMANPIFTNKVIQEEKLEEFSHISYKKLLFTAEKDVACRFNYAYLFDGNGEKRINDEFRDADKVVGMKKMKQIINS